jgi:hypothetical protein
MSQVIVPASFTSLKSLFLAASYRDVIGVIEAALFESIARNIYCLPFLRTRKQNPRKVNSLISRQSKPNGL